MKITKPSYFDSFRCLTGACPDSCCHEWEVQVDADTAERYLSYSGELGKRLRENLKPDGEGQYVLVNTAERRCPMWREDGLCAIQAQHGEDALCQVCHDFPRLRHDYGDFVELGLELSCPEAARLILAGESHTIREEIPGGGEPDYDRETMKILLRTRQEALTILKNPGYTVPEALTLLLLYGYRAQEELDGGEQAVCDAPSELAFARQAAVSGDWEKLRTFYGGLEILTDRWRQRLAAPRGGGWHPALRSFAGYLVERYWLQAVSDYDLVCRVKFILAGCLLVHHLGGSIPETAQLYSKEIENDMDNVEAILDGAYTHPALTDTNLLGLLQEEPT